MVWDTQDVPIDTDFGPSHQQMENGGQAAMLYLLLRRKVAAADPPSLTPAQQKKATKRTQGATLQELANSYDRSISTMGRATRTG